MTTLLELLAKANADPITSLLAVGSVWIYRRMVEVNGAEIAHNLADAYRPKGVP